MVKTQSHLKLGYGLFVHLMTCVSSLIFFFKIPQKYISCAYNYDISKQIASHQSRRNTEGNLSFPLESPFCRPEKCKPISTALILLLLSTNIENMYVVSTHLICHFGKKSLDTILCIILLFILNNTTLFKLQYKSLSLMFLKLCCLLLSQQYIKCLFLDRRMFFCSISGRVISCILYLSICARCASHFDRVEF